MRDPQDFGFAFTSFTVAHGFHRVNQSSLQIEAHDKILDLIFEQYEQQGCVLVHSLPVYP